VQGFSRVFPFFLALIIPQKRRYFLISRGLFFVQWTLINDPHERHNLIDDPALQIEIARHREIMLNWYQETCDAVPQKLDQRFNIEMLLQMRGIQLSKKNMEVLK